MYYESQYQIDRDSFWHPGVWFSYVIDNCRAFSEGIANVLVSSARGMNVMHGSLLLFSTWRNEIKKDSFYLIWPVNTWLTMLCDMSTWGRQCDGLIPTPFRVFSIGQALLFILSYFEQIQAYCLPSTHQNESKPPVREVISKELTQSDSFCMLNAPTNSTNKRKVSCLHQLY